MTYNEMKTRAREAAIERQQEIYDEIDNLKEELIEILDDQGMYIGRTAAYYDCDDDYIFVPDLWDIEEDAEKLAGDIYELTEEGEELCYRYFHDLSCGYDLCNGRAKGLAAEYSREEFFAYVTDEKNGYIK